MIKWLTSMKTAVIFMILIIIASILATFFPELNIYKSIWYRGILVFFCFNLLLCTVKTIPRACQNLNKSPEISEKKPPVGEKVKLNNSKHTEKNILQHLKQQGYKLNSTASGHDTAVVAHKGLINYFAPHALHLALIIVFIGALVSSFGVSENIPCYVGQSVDIPSELIAGIEMKVESFKTTYDQEGNIENWVSKIRLLKDEESIAHGIVKVNHPFVFQGVKFYQSGYGADHLIAIEGKGEFSIPTDKPVGVTDDQGLLINSTNNGYEMELFDDYQQLKRVPLSEGQVIDFKDTKVEYKRTQKYTILTVKRNPGTAIVMFGLACTAATSLLFWSRRYRRVYLEFNHQDSYIQYKVNSKDEEIKQQVKEYINNHIKG
ncbi:MAG: cytochrome c biogenesis protein ResB [Firmicutes bacterium]|nr:cytochrome c biogenesis protein ResB [Bacillota bacterium]